MHFCQLFHSSKRSTCSRLCLRLYRALEPSWITEPPPWRVLMWRLMKDQHPHKPLYAIQSSIQTAPKGLLQDLRQSEPLDQNINLTRIQTHRLPDIPVSDVTVPTVLCDLGVAKKSEAFPTDLQSRFHITQARYRDHQCIFTDGSKHDNKVRCAVVYDGCFLRERIPDTPSVYTAELRANFFPCNLLQKR